VRRVLAASNTPIQNFRELLVARLAAKAPASDGLADLVLEYILEDYHAQRRHELAVRWLYSLFSSLCPAKAAEQTDEERDEVMADGGEDGGEEGGEGMEVAGVIEGDDAAAAGVRLRMGSVGEGVESGAAAAAVAGGEDEHHPGLLVDQESLELQALLEQADADANMGEEQQEQQQQHGMSGGSSDEGGNTSDLSDTVYQEVLLALLEGLREKLPGNDRAIIGLLAEAPVIPYTAVLSFLEELLQQGGEWSELALRSAWQLIDDRPPLRLRLLNFVLGVCVNESVDTRESAVRLVVNKLWNMAGLRKRVLAYAREQLGKLLQPVVVAAALKEEGGGEATAAVACVEGGDGAAANGAPGTRDQTQQQQEAQPADQHGQGADGQQRADAGGGGGEGGDGAAAAVKEEAATRELTQEDAACYCHLYMKLCSVEHALLQHLLVTYGRAGDLGEGSVTGKDARICRLGYHLQYAEHVEIPSSLLQNVVEGFMCCPVCCGVLEVMLHLPLSGCWGGLGRH
jgi:hypothetical protein